MLIRMQGQFTFHEQLDHVKNMQRKRGRSFN
jgi:hypothetical protein